eukprot:TRINITY_DN5042_c0_g1_i1.p1 TRINITY_DN5042_c0_g1~~TRINITY_DN5042_c0_g1_i1.p1  ORF type:complete len:492 (-),score=126.82 TRINITY_DN5042_c0_g1_i1:183-1658(-)
MGCGAGKAARVRHPAEPKHKKEGTTAAVVPCVDCTQQQHFDAVVIGGGSGGVAFATEASKLGANVALFDCAPPSPKLGRVAVKLLHRAALIGAAAREDAAALGWQGTAALQLDWAALVAHVQEQVRAESAGKLDQLAAAHVRHINAFGRLVDAHTVECDAALLRGKHVVVATGFRPRALTCPGAELCVAPGDLFSLKQAPGKTLVVGGARAALECAGVLRGIGCEVTVMARSVLLRGCDQQLSDMVGQHMESVGIKFLRGCTPDKIERVNGKLKVSWAGGKDEFDTVLCAIGCSPVDIGAAQAGVMCNPASGKIVTNAQDQSTSSPSIFVIGGSVSEAATRAGGLLAHRLFGGGTEPMNYDNVPSVVFTPLEYGFCGMSEEEAQAGLGPGKVDVYHTTFKPLEEEFAAHAHPRPDCYCKVVVNRTNGRVVGLHILAPDAAEIVQGFSVAMKCGATKSHFDQTLGIHPTTAEVFTTLTITKASGDAAAKHGC